MDQNKLLIIMLIVLLSKSNIVMSDPIFMLIHDLVQNNVAGAPITHQKTEWNFDPDVGKQRRIRYEQENGRFGEIAIAKLGLGIGYKEPWGTPMHN